MRKEHFKHFFSSETVQIISTDEEIAADAFGLIILSLELESVKDEIMMYSPRLLFLLLALFDECELLPKSEEHPPNDFRLSTIKDMTSELNSSLKYDNVDKCIAELWNEGCEDVRRRVEKERKLLKRTYYRFLKVQDKMVDRGYPKIFETN